MHNPTTGWSSEEFHRNGEAWQRILTSGENNICWYNNIPLTIPTHSDYYFNFDIFIGNEITPFDCDTCSFGGDTSYFYVGAIEDSIVFDKWLTKPNATSVGIPGVYVVTEREEYLSHNDDCNYTNQATTDWGNSSYTCKQKDTGVDQLTNLSVYPRAGEKFKVCYQAHNYFSEEVDLEFYDIYIDSDEGETVIQYEHENDGYVPSIQEDSLYLSETPSRAFELGGGLVDSYGSMCSNWMDLPLNLQGGNNWDIQGKVRINSDIYNLPEEVVWNWESDEFPIFGSEKIKSYPDYLTINDFKFTKDNATEGEFFRFKVNVTNNLDYEVNSIFHASAHTNLGGPQKEFTLVDYDTGENYGSFLHTAFTLPASSTGVYISQKIKVPYGFKDVNTYDIIDAHFLIHVLDSTEGNTLYTQFWDGAVPTIDVTAKGFEITNITTTTSGVACGPVIHTITYDNILSQTSAATGDERYIAKGCIEETGNDYYIDCVDFEIQPDEGEDKTLTFATTLPYVSANVSSEIDVWIYSYDKSNLDTECLHCGELVDLSSGTDYNDEFNITLNSDESCRYSKRTITWEDDEAYNNYLSRVASESSSTSSSRSADALEGIENKTGTFHLDVACPSTATIGNDISCDITAYVEDSQTVQKEVDFTCYISDGSSTYSSLNFNQMITKTAITMNKNFSIPSSFAEGTSYVLQCTADYYNLGSRRDSFYDTFTTSGTTSIIEESSGGTSSDGGYVEDGTPGITGGAIDDKKPFFSPEIKEFNPFSPDRNWAFMFLEAIILISLIIFIIWLAKRKKKQRHQYHHHSHSSREKINWAKVFKTIGAIILILAIISGIATGIFYGYKFLQTSAQETIPVIQSPIIQQTVPVEQATITQGASSIFLQGSLPKSIFLIGLAILIISLIILLFMTILIILIVKLLGLRGEIRLGDYRPHYDKKLTKLQSKINRHVLKKELKDLKK